MTRIGHAMPADHRVKLVDLSREDRFKMLIDKMNQRDDSEQLIRSPFIKKTRRSNEKEQKK